MGKGIGDAVRRPTGRNVSRFVTLALILPFLTYSWPAVPAGAAQSITQARATAASPSGPSCSTATLAAGFGHYLAIDAADG